MTVNTTDITSGPYTGNGVTTEFAYTFRVENKSQVTVYETDLVGTITVLTVDTDYTVGGISTDVGGTITRVAGPLTSGYTWYIRSNYNETQLTSFSSQGAFFPEVHEAAMDKTTFLIQQLNDQLTRSAKFADSYSGTGAAELPAPAPGFVMQWNTAGDGFDNVLLGTVAIVGSISEEQTAISAGQALFTLASITYTPGTKNISVYRNGARIPFTSFTQTSTSSITLLTAEATAVQIGDEFEFVVNERSVSADVISDASVTHVNPDTSVSSVFTELTALQNLVQTGAGTPEGAVTAVVGTLFTRTDGGASTTLYVKESGTGNTGWVAK